MPFKMLQFFSKTYLAGYAVYVALLFNIQFDKVLDWYALGLLIFGFCCVRPQSITGLWRAVLLNTPTKVFTVSLFGLVIVLSIATFQQLPRTIGILSLGAQCWVPFGLSIVTVLILIAQKSKDAHLFFLKIFVAGAITIAGFDLWIYYEQWAKLIPMDVGNPHRELADAYIFFIPFIWAIALQAQSAVKKVLLWGLLLLISFIAIGSGARGIYIAILLEWVLLIGLSLTPFFFGKLLLPFKKTILLLALLTLLIWIAATYFFPHFFWGAIDRGFGIEDRILHTWNPTWFFITKQPWAGYGFGPSIWNEVYAANQIYLPGALNVGSAHNWALQLGFLGGLPAVALIIFFTIAFFWQFTMFVSTNRLALSLKKIAFSAGLTYFAFFMIRGLVETPNWKPFYLLTAIFLYLIWQFKKGPPNPSTAN